MRVLGGKYEVDELLGAGGMGSVFAGRHIGTGRRVAVKLLHEEPALRPEVVTRFMREARLATAVDHPNVVQILDVDLDGGLPFLVMERLDGEPLSALIAREAPMRGDALVSLLDPVLDALERAHARGITHRDLKPDNIFLARDATGRIVPKVLDFGIAHWRAPDAGMKLTRTGAVLGTPLYMSPEQAAGDPEIGPATDQYAMAAVLYEALTGRPPHQAETYNALLAALLMQAPTPLDELRPDLPPALCAAITRALAKKPAARFAGLAELRRALRVTGQRESLSDTMPSVPPSSAAPTREASLAPTRDDAAALAAAADSAASALRGEAPAPARLVEERVVAGAARWPAQVAVVATLVVALASAAWVIARLRDPAPQAGEARTVAPLGDRQAALPLPPRAAAATDGASAPSAAASAEPVAPATVSVVPTEPHRRRGRRDRVAPPPPVAPPAAAQATPSAAAPPEPASSSQRSGGLSASDLVD